MCPVGPHQGAALKMPPDGGLAVPLTYGSREANPLGTLSE